jgi:quercetin 2,3-dioxygenase
VISRRSLLAGGAAGAGLVALGCQRRRHAADVRAVDRVVDARPSRDGAGVALRRALGTAVLPMLDPFLMLDEIKSPRAADSQAGFPWHPHRGFETVSYLIAGAFEHADSVGNRGRIADGGAQWMTAGRGIVHEEMPRQDDGRLLWGLQLWINLPASHKGIAPHYQDLDGSAVPELDVGGAAVRLVAGAVDRRRGPVEGIVTDPTMLDAALPASAALRLAVPGGHASFVYVLDGDLAIGEPGAPGGRVRAGQLAALGHGAELAIAGAPAGRALILAAAPIREPVARRGPFVMTTDAELEQAFQDYRAGRLGT